MLTRRDLLRSAAATPVAAALPFPSIDAAQAQGSAQVIDLLKMYIAGNDHVETIRVVSFIKNCFADFQGCFFHKRL